MDFIANPNLDSVLLAFDLDQFEADYATKLMADGDGQAYCDKYREQKNNLGSGYESDGFCQALYAAIKNCEATWNRADARASWIAANQSAHAAELAANAAANALDGGNRKES